MPTQGCHTAVQVSTLPYSRRPNHTHSHATSIHQYDQHKQQKRCWGYSKIWAPILGEHRGLVTPSISPSSTALTAFEVSKWKLGRKYSQDMPQDSNCKTGKEALGRRTLTAMVSVTMLMQFANLLPPFSSETFKGDMPTIPIQKTDRKSKSLINENTRIFHDCSLDWSD